VRLPEQTFFDSFLCISEGPAMGAVAGESREAAAQLLSEVRQLPPPRDAQELVSVLRRRRLLGPDDVAHGATKIFLRQDAAAALEDLRYDGTVRYATSLQAQIRGSLGRRMHARREALVKRMASAVEARDEAALSAVLRSCGELSNGGLHLAIFREARTLQVRLREETRVNGLLEEAARAMDLKKLKSAVATVKFMAPAMTGAHLETACYILDSRGRCAADIAAALAASDYDRLVALLEEAKKLGVAQDEGVLAAQAQLPRLQAEDAAKKALQADLDAADKAPAALAPAELVAKLRAHQEALGKLGLGESAQWSSAEARILRLGESKDALALLGSTLAAAAKTRYLPPLEAAYKKAEALGADPADTRMEEARLLLEELQLEATVREAEAAGGPADEDEEGMGGSDGARRASQGVVAHASSARECEALLKEAIRNRNTGALASAIADATTLGLTPERSVVLRTATRTHTKWVAEFEKRRRARAIEAECRAAIDAHDQSALQVALQAAAEAGMAEEEFSWLDTAKKTHQAWLTEANAWRSQVSRRMGVIKLVKLALADGGVAVTKLEEAAAQLEAASSWLKEAKVWQPQVGARMEQVKSVRGAALGSGVELSTLAAASALLEEEMPWLGEAGEKVHWRKRLSERSAAVAQMRAAVADDDVDGELIEDGVQVKIRGLSSILATTCTHSP